MPVICVFENENIKIYIYNFDHREPHIHIVKKGATSKKGVTMLLDGSLPHGYEGLTGKDIELVRKWLATHVEEVSERWIEGESGTLTGEQAISPKLESTERTTMPVDIYVSNAIAVPGKLLLCEFNEGWGYSIYDLKPLLSRPAFFGLNNDTTFYNVDCSNGVPNWDNERIDISPEHLYTHGMHINRLEYDYLKYLAEQGKAAESKEVIIPIIEGFIAYMEATHGQT